MFLVLFVLDNAEKLDQVLDVWEETGVTGITILHSSGLGRARRVSGMRDDLPLMPSLKNLFDQEEYFSRTLFTVVNDEQVVDRLVAATQAITGSLDDPETGLLVVMPVARAYGLSKLQSGKE